MGTNVEISLNTDEQGFLSQECPSCEERFKVRMGEGSDEPISFCPFCGHNGQDCWWTPEQADYMSAIATEEVLGPELDKLDKSLSHLGGNGLFSIEASLSRPTPSERPEEPDDDWPTQVFGCCGETIKHARKTDSLFCIICRSESPVEPGAA